MPIDFDSLPARSALVGRRDFFTGRGLIQGRQWLVDQYLREAIACGWPYLAAHSPVSLWEGTLDAIRGLNATSAGPLMRELSESLEWVLSLQDTQDGGFPGEGVPYGRLQTTAWTAIALRELGVKDDDDAVVRDDRWAECLRRARQFVEECVILNSDKSARRDGSLCGGVALTPGAKEEREPCTFPSALALIAVGSRSPKADDIAGFLLRQRDVRTGAWGFHPLPASPLGEGPAQQLRPSSAATAHALNALLVSGKLSPKHAHVTQAAGYLASTQQAEGFWTNEIEQVGGARKTHTHFVTPWVIMALVEAQFSTVDDRPLRKAIGWMADQQQTDGSYFVDPTTPGKAVFGTANAMLAMRLARDALLVEVGRRPDLWHALMRGGRRFGTRLEFFILALLAVLIAAAIGGQLARAATSLASIVRDHLAGVVEAVVGGLFLLGLAWVAGRTSPRLRAVVRRLRRTEL